MTTFEELIDWLHLELNKRGWDQAELARRAHINPAIISRIMSGERKAGATTCTAIARALRVPPEEVFRHAGLLPKQKSPSDQSEELLYHFQNLSEEDKEYVMIFVRALHKVHSVK